MRVITVATDLNCGRGGAVTVIERITTARAWGCGRLAAAALSASEWVADLRDPGQILDVGAVAVWTRSLGQADALLIALLPGIGLTATLLGTCLALGRFAR